MKKNNKNDKKVVVSILENTTQHSDEGLNFYSMIDVKNKVKYIQDNLLSIMSSVAKENPEFVSKNDEIQNKFFYGDISFSHKDKKVVCSILEHTTQHGDKGLNFHSHSMIDVKNKVKYIQDNLLSI